MKLVSVILLFLLGHTGFAQTLIKLAYTDQSSGYQLKRPKDSIFVTTGYRADMGQRYGNYYRFRDSLPDGHYQVYVNDTIRENLFIKDYKPYDVRTQYHKGRKASQEVFLNKEERLHLSFYPDGKTEHIAKTRGLAPYIRVSYYETGTIKMLEYFIANIHSRVEQFDGKGYVTRVDDEYNPEAKFVSAEVFYKEGHFEGTHRIRFMQGDFEVTFSGNKIVNWKFTSHGTVLNESGFSQAKEEN